MIKGNPLFRSGSGASQSQPLSHMIQLPEARLQEDCGSSPSSPNSIWRMEGHHSPFYHLGDDSTAILP